MVVGYDETDDSNHDVEIVDLTGQNKTCRKPANYYNRCASNGIFFNGKAMVCGGEYPVTNKCFEFDAQVNCFINCGFSGYSTNDDNCCGC